MTLTSESYWQRRQSDVIHAINTLLDDSIQPSNPDSQANTPLDTPLDIIQSYTYSPRDAIRSMSRGFGGLVRRSSSIYSTLSSRDSGSIDSGGPSTPRRISASSTSTAGSNGVNPAIKGDDNDDEDDFIAPDFVRADTYFLLEDLFNKEGPLSPKSDDPDRFKLTFNANTHHYERSKPQQAALNLNTNYNSMLPLPPQQLPRSRIAAGRVYQEDTRAEAAVRERCNNSSSNNSSNNAGGSGDRRSSGLVPARDGPRGYLELYTPDLMVSTVPSRKPHVVTAPSHAPVSSTSSLSPPLPHSAVPARRGAVQRKKTPQLSVKTRYSDVPPSSPSMLAPPQVPPKIITDRRSYQPYRPAQPGQLRRKYSWEAKENLSFF